MRRRYRILACTWRVLLEHASSGRSIDEALIARTDRAMRWMSTKYPDRVNEWGWDLDVSPVAEIEVDLNGRNLRRVLEALPELVDERMAGIHGVVRDVVRDQEEVVQRVVEVLAHWMSRKVGVRVIAAGRANLATAIPANRLAHGGAEVSMMGDRAPLPNSSSGGGLLVGSASGKTEAVLDVMRHVSNVNRERKIRELEPIVVVGIADVKAGAFARLCTPGCFIGLPLDRYIGDVRLRELGDIGELALAELLDCLVVAAGRTIGVNFRSGHEDLGAGGPWDQYRTE